jgi:hypothetical protein
MDMTYDFEIVLITEFYDLDEKAQQVTYGHRKHVGTEATAMAAARRTRTQATTAQISRVAVHRGPRFQAHEIRSFSIGLEPRA